MNKTLLNCAVMGAFLWGSGVQADRSGAYLAGSVGAGFALDGFFVTEFNDLRFGLDTKYNVGFTGGAAFGYNWAPYRLRTELEYVYQSNDWNRIGDSKIDSGGVESHNFLANIYYDVPGLGPWVPFFGAGIGLGHFNFGTNNLKDNGLTLQTSVGLAYQINNNISVDVKYRYLTTDGLKDRDNGQNVLYRLEYETSNVYAGLRYSF